MKFEAQEQVVEKERWAIIVRGLWVPDQIDKRQRSQEARVME